MGLFGSSKKPKPVVIGHRYYVGMHMIVGHGNMDACEKIRVGEKVVWTPSNTLKDSNTAITTSRPATPQGWLAQTFTASEDYTLCSVSLMMWRSGNDLYYPGTITVSIRATDVDGHPTGNDLCVGTTDGDTLPDGLTLLSQAEWREIEFDNPILLTSGTKYAIIIRTTESADYDSVNWNANNNQYADGNNEESDDCGKTWTTSVSNLDFLFKTYQKNGTPPNHTINIDENYIFGGERSEGGISGYVDVLFGDTAQTQNSYLVGKLGSAITAFRGLMSFVLKQVYVGTSPYIKPWSFFCKRVGKQISGDNQWYREKAVIHPRDEDGDDLNAAHIIRECLINKEWGLGYDADEDLNDDYFKEAANILYDENFGLSILWDQNNSIEDFIDSILECINGFLYQDLETGKLLLTLTRDPDFDNPYDSYTSGSNYRAVTSGGVIRYAQIFKTSKNYKADKIEIEISRGAVGYTANARVELQGVNADGEPDGNILGYGLIPSSSISTDIDWVECNFSSLVDLTVNTEYAIVIYSLSGTGYINLGYDNHGTYESRGYHYSDDSGSTWTPFYQYNLKFKVYAGADIETFDENEIIEIEDFVRPSYGEVINQVVVNWWDKLANKPRPATAQDIALIEKENNNIIETIINHYGICNKTLANQVAERELKVASSMLASMRIKATRKMSHLKPNNVFRLSWDDLGIVQMVVRVLEVNYGNLDKNEIILNCIEDSFSIAETIYEDSPDTSWIDLVSDPTDVVNRRLIEVPYWSLCNDWENKNIIDGYDDDTGFMYIIASPPVLDSFDFNYSTQYDDGYDFEAQGIGSWTPTATLVDNLAMSAEDITIDIENIISIENIIEGTYAVINNEIIKIVSVDSDNNQISITRGILDTVPESHSAGDMVYFAGSNYQGVNIEYTDGDSPKVKIFPRTASGILESTSVTTEITFNSRMIRPYLPGNLKFNGESYPNFISSGAHSNKIAITWNHRDRTDAIQLQSLVEHLDSANYGPEAGTTYTIKIYDSSLTNLVRTITGLSGISYDYTEAFEIADCGSLQGQLRFVITAVRDGYDSWLNYDITLRRSFRGSVDAVSGTGGNLSTYFDRRNTVNEISSIDGDLSVITQLKSSSFGTSIVNANMYFAPSLIGLIVGSSGIDGDMTVEVDEILQDYYNNIADEDGNAGIYDTRWEAQTFTANQAYTIKSVKLRLSADTDATGKTITVSIRAVDGGTGKPAGGDLCFGTLTGNSIGIGDENRNWHEIDLGAGYSLSNGVQYAVVARSDETGANIMWWLDGSSPSYAGGARVNSNNSGVDWFTPSTGFDFIFETYGG